MNILVLYIFFLQLTFSVMDMNKLTRGGWISGLSGTQWSIPPRHQFSPDACFLCTSVQLVILSTPCSGTFLFFPPFPFSLPCNRHTTVLCKTGLFSKSHFVLSISPWLVKKIGKIICTITKTDFFPPYW